MNIFQNFAFEDVMRIAIAVAVVVATLLALSYTIWGGFLMVVSGGDEEKIKKAVNHIRHAIIGVGFLLAVIFIFPTLMNLIGLPYGNYVRPQAIFDTMSSISDSIF